MDLAFISVFLGQAASETQCWTWLPSGGSSGNDSIYVVYPVILYHIPSYLDMQTTYTPLNGPISAVWVIKHQFWHVTSGQGYYVK